MGDGCRICRQPANGGGILCQRHWLAWVGSPEFERRRNGKVALTDFCRAHPGRGKERAPWLTVGG